ncbi:MAG: TIM barrel protein [SAR202 cluster bacterium]|nr:TIM barrel protein [SAR202 cluster bacterium]
MPKLDASLVMLFNEVGMLDRFESASAAGFGGIEIQMPYDYQPDQLGERLGSNDIECVLLNMPVGDLSVGDRGLACIPGREIEFRESVKEALIYAKALECRLLNCLAGVPPLGFDAVEVRKTLVRNLQMAADLCGEVDVGIVIEPLNTRDFPGVYLKHLKQSRSVIDEVGLTNVGLQYDVYHMQIMEGDLIRGIEEHIDVIRHIQIADNPGRHEPGTGEINIQFILERLDELAYDHWVGCEWIPSTTTEGSLKWAKKWLH